MNKVPIFRKIRSLLFYRTRLAHKFQGNGTRHFNFEEIFREFYIKNRLNLEICTLYRYTLYKRKFIYKTTPAKNGFIDVPDDDFCLRIELQTATPVNR